VEDCLAVALAPFRNREAAFTLAVFIARFWSVPGRVALGFHIDRRELANREDLGLTEDRVRGAIRALEAVGFLERAIPPSGSAYKATPDGLHRKPIKFLFGPEYAPAFLAANKRAEAARGGDQRARRALPTDVARQPSAAFSVGRDTISPKSRREADPQVNLGEIVKTSGLPAKPSQDSALERALQRLGEAIGKPRVG
jgi:hypothetical protein